jgi:polyhydroxybutyrate depolymerase
VAPGREANETVHTATLTGTYELLVPRTYNADRPAPLIVLFYGFDSTPSQFSSLTALPARGAKDGYLVAVPHTQAGEPEWQFSGTGTDATFVNGVVTALEQRYCVDRSAVFAAGFSAGAAFTIAYSCAHENQIAAITTVAVEFQLGCKKPMPILAFHGTKDPLVRYQNGTIGLSLPGIKVRGTELNMSDWARLDHCRPDPRRSVIGSQVIRQQWERCTRATQVILYTIVGGGHTWPGADPSKGLGLTTQQVNATTQALSFFGQVRS